MRSLIAAFVAFLAVLAAPSMGSAQERVHVASFNIQFLGSSTRRDNEALADLLEEFDLVFVQELVAPPYPGSFPDGDPFRPDPQARAFFDAMNARGFDFILSEEDTGTGSRIHLNSNATEWHVAFYRPGRVTPIKEHTRFLAEDRSNHPDYERVPYAFGFRAGSEDLVFISVHLKPDPGPSNVARRAHELGAIWNWIRNREGDERDYVILGDMNFQNCPEMEETLPSNAISLNGSCEETNTNGGRPYDHVMFRPQFTEDEIPGELSIVDLIEEMRTRWDSANGAFPGDPYNHTRFRSFYSDHHPIAFDIVVDGEDDD